MVDLLIPFTRILSAWKLCCVLPSIIHFFFLPSNFSIQLNTVVKSVKKNPHSQNNVFFLVIADRMRDRKTTFACPVCCGFNGFLAFLTWNNSMVYQNAVSGLVNFTFSLLGL